MKLFGVTLEEQEIVTKDAGTTISAIGLAFTVVESLHPGTLRSLILFLRDLTIPKEQILRLRLDEPEKISEILSEEAHKGKRKSSRPVGRKPVAKDKRSKKG